MHRRNSSPQDNLDSLLDTVANIVGILLIVLVAVFLTVGGAVESMYDDYNTVDQGHLNEAELEAAGKSLERQVIDTARMRAEWEEWELRERSATAKLNSLERYISEGGQTDKNVTAVIHDPIQAQRSLDRLESTRTELTVKIKQLENTAAQKMKVLKTEMERQPMPPSVRLPDPKPAPDDKEPLVFFCRYDRIWEYGEFYAELLEYVLAKTEIAKSRPSLFAGGMPSFVRYLNRERVERNGLRWELHALNDDILAKLTWSDQAAGESEATVRAEGGLFARELKEHPSDTHYVYFVVWSDSFGVYLAARSLVEKYGYRAGWSAFDVSESHVVSMLSRGSGGGLHTD